MRHGIGDQRMIDDDIIRLSKELNIKIIATNDTHYTFKERAVAHEVFMCIAMGKNLMILIECVIVCMNFMLKALSK